MERRSLHRQIRDARSPHEISVALGAARDWLRQHPDDVETGLAMLELLQIEDQTLRKAS
jgi:hypothetical protein